MSAKGHLRTCSDGKSLVCFYQESGPNRGRAGGGSSPGPQRVWEAWGFVNAENPSLISRGTFTSNFVPTIVTDRREVMPTELAGGSAQESLMM